MSGKNPYLFLLGGHDLEMLEIRKILEERKIPYFDNHLKWGAKLSAYKKILEKEKNNYGLIYGIELVQDMEPPMNFRVIDHHGNFSPRPTAYEQVAEILNIDVSDRRSQLVIMNDVGHKKGMLTICATKMEIQEIRADDRKAQGIKDEWMNQAKAEIENVIYKSGIAIIETSLDSFTPITDQCNYSKLIIHNKHGLTYYGIEALKKVKVHFEKVFENTGNNLLYSGGLFDGFIGFTEQAFNIKSKEDIMHEIIEQVKSEECFSTHAFMLPLKWDYIKYNKDKEQIDFDERTNLNDFNKLLLLTEKPSLWQRKFYNIDYRPDNFNEITYFHTFVSKVIFDTQNKDEKNTSIVSKDKVMTYYQIDTNADSYYEINIADDCVYKLKLTGLSLHAYYTGVLIVTFNLENYYYGNKEDILKINEFGRRFYPQFLGANEPHTQQTKSAFLACRISLNINGELIEEDFSKYNDLSNLKTPCYINNDFKYNALIHPPAFIKRLFSNNFVYNRDDEKKGTIRLARITDDRMFFQCWYGKSNLANNLGSYGDFELGRLKLEKHAYLNDDYWYAFINGDKDYCDCTIKNDLMQEEQMKKQTYSRWVDYYDKSNMAYGSTIFGFSRDSFVCLAGWQEIRKHMKTMYYHMAVLCLAQRASVLRFSGENTIISNLVNNNDANNKRKKQATDRIRSVYKNYIEFINKIYFREVSSQIQAIEMYSQFQEVMNIHKDVKDLDSEIGELHNYVIMEEQHEIATNSWWLNCIAFPILTASLIFGIFGSNFLSSKMPFLGEPDTNAIYWIILGLGIPVLLIVIFFLIKKIIKK